MTMAGSTAVPEKAAADLAAGFRGTVLRPGGEGYEGARHVWNAMIDRRPALIARCAGAADVVRAVNVARHHGLELSVRGGGHNVAGHGTCDEGLVIDLVEEEGDEVDPVARVARVGGGATWGQVDAATQVHGLAAPGGVFSGTGVAGLTLGDTAELFFNDCVVPADNLIGAEVVTASGQVVRASAAENADLLWGLRGGGGNFGVVTTFEFQLHPVGPEVMFVFAFHDGGGDNMKRAIQLYRDYSASAPDEVSSILACGVIPPDPHAFPVDLHGRPFVLLGTAFNFVHLVEAFECASRRYVLPPGSRVMETGGYKGRSREMPKADLHAALVRHLGVAPDHIVREYGMSELSSQAYDRVCGEREDSRRFRFPPWARALVISPETGRDVDDGGIGLIRVFDLANVFSVLAVQTEDLGIRRGDGFELLGRAPRAEARGCSLLAAGGEGGR